MPEYGTFANSYRNSIWLRMPVPSIPVFPVTILIKPRTELTSLCRRNSMLQIRAAVCSQQTPSIRHVSPLSLSSLLLPSFFFLLRPSPSREQFHVQTYATHEEIDVCKTLARHRWWQCLSKGDCFHDAVFHSHDESLLLVGARSNADRSKKLPHIHIFTSVDSTWENVRKGGLKCIKEFIVCGDPKNCQSYY
jgi:hypothetical protein